MFWTRTNLVFDSYKCCLRSRTNLVFSPKAWQENPVLFGKSMKLVEVALIGRLWSGTLVAGIWEGWLSEVGCASLQVEQGGSCVNCVRN